MSVNNSFEYLKRLIFETDVGQEYVFKQVSKAKKEGKIPAEKIWMGIYFDQEITNNTHPAISIRLIDDVVGYGVFANQKILPYSFVGEYTGIVQERSIQQLKEKKYVVRYPIWEGTRHFCIDAEHQGNFTRFMNHSEKPNLILKSVYWRGMPRMIFLSIQPIREGDQLTFDYGPLFWKEMKQTPHIFSNDH